MFKEIVDERQRMLGDHKSSPGHIRYFLPSNRILKSVTAIQTFKRVTG